MTKTKKNNNLKRRLIVGGLILVIVAAGIYWYKATEKQPLTKGEKSAYTVNAIEFIREFRVDKEAARKKYEEKIITVKGRISSLEYPDTATVNIKIIDPSTGDYVIFDFQEQYRMEARALHVDDSVSVKGSCSGVSYSSILEVNFIPFKRSTLDTK